MTKILLFLSIFIILCSSVLATTIFNDSFTQPDDTQINGYNSWDCRLASPQTKVISNVAFIARTGVGNPTTDDTCVQNLSNDGFLQVDSTINFSFKLTTTNNMLAGICPVDKIDANNYCGGWNSAGDWPSVDGYYFVGGGNIDLRKLESGVTTNIFDDFAVVNANDVFTLEIINNGTQHLNVYENGVLKGTTTDSTFTTLGAIGIGSWVGSYYDDVFLSLSYDYFQNPTPADGINEDSQQIINVTCDSDSVTLWHDANTNPVTKVLDAVSSPGNYTTTVAEGTYYYKASCDNGSINSSTRSWIYDVTDPDIELISSNFFSTINNSNISRLQENKNLIFNITDNNEVFGYEINVTNKSGITLYYKLNETLTGTTVNVSEYINFSSWDLGNYTIILIAADTHTATTIKDYKPKKTASKLEYNTDEGNYIYVYSEQASLTNTWKDNDRYKFSFDFYDKGKKERVYHIVSDHKIRYMQDSKYAAHFVVWNSETKEGNWIDFEGEDSKPIIKKIDDYHYTVSFKNSKDIVVFNSIGGLNTNTEVYGFSLVTLYPFNLKYYFGDQQQYTKVGEFIGPVNISADIGYINSILEGACNCSGCSIVSENCRIPLSFNIDTSISGGINVTLLNASYAYGIDNCSNSLDIDTNATALNISFFNLDGILTNTDYESIFEYGFSTNYNSTYSVSGNDDNYKICIYPSWSQIYADALIDYNNTFTYNTYQLNLTNITQQIELIVPVVTTTEVTFTVIDYDTLPVEDAYIQIQLYDIASNSYKTTEIIKTDSQGETVGNIIIGTEYYRFIVQYEGETKLIEPATQGTKIYSTEITFRITLGAVEWYDNYDEVQGIDTSFTFNTTGTDSFVFTWTNPTGTTVEGCLKVLQKNQTGQTTLLDSCTTSAGASIVGSITPGDCNTYIGIAYFNYDNDVFNIGNSPIEVKIDCDTSFKGLKGDSGNLELVLLSWMVIFALAFVGIFMPEVSFILATVGMIGMVAIGMLSIAWQWVVGWIVIGIMLILKHNKK